MSFEFENLMQIFIREYDKISYKISMLSNICNRKLIQEREKLTRDTLGLKRGAPKIMDFQMQALRLLEEKAHAANPETQLKRGFTITKNQNGKVLRSAKEAEASTALITVFADGEAHSVLPRN